MGCGLAPLPKEASSYGLANRGVLLRGVRLADRGPGFVRARAGEDTRWGTARLIGLLTRSAAAVERAYPGGAPLYVGDVSARFGGRHARHGSHRSGRDADVLFYLKDAAGRSVRGSGFFSFDERGVGFVSKPGAPVSGLAFFDDARNWAFVRALLTDEEAPAQWIFCADGVKGRLLAYAAVHETDPRVLVRASYVLHQPSYGNPHRDHFHVRISCTAEERALGCQDPGPIWPWWRNAHEKPHVDGPGHDDATLVQALLADPSELVALAKE